MTNRSFVLMAFMIAICLISCTRMGRKPSDKKLLSLDSAAIEGWEVWPSKALKTSRYKIVREKGQWMVMLPSGETALADKEYIRRSLQHLASLKASEEIRVDKAGLDSMGVADSGTLLKVTAKGRTELELIIGKMFFRDNKSAYYVRPAGERIVYSVPLYLEGSLIAEPARVRQKDLLPFSIAYITDIKFLGPQGIESTLTREAETGKWKINGKPAEEKRVAGYLQALHSLVISRFGEAPETGAVRGLVVTAADGAVAQIRVSQKNSDTWILSSPENPGNYAEIDNAAITALFPGEEYFSPGK